MMVMIQNSKHIYIIFPLTPLSAPNFVLPRSSPSGLPWSSPNLLPRRQRFYQPPHVPPEHLLVDQLGGDGVLRVPDKGVHSVVDLPDGVWWNV